MSRISSWTGLFADPAEEARYRAFATRPRRSGGGGGGGASDDGLDLCLAPAARVTLRRWGYPLRAGSFVLIQVMNRP